MSASVRLFGPPIYARAKGPASPCVVWNDACPSAPTFDGVWVNDAVGTTASLCAQRAAQYRSWCGSPRPGEDRTMSVYVPTNTGQRVLSRGCRIAIGGACAGNPSLTNATFVETTNGAGTSRTACRDRARDYSNFCAAHVESTMYDPNGHAYLYGCDARTIDPARCSVYEFPIQNPIE